MVVLETHKYLNETNKTNLIFKMPHLFYKYCPDFF